MTFAAMLPLGVALALGEPAGTTPASAPGGLHGERSLLSPPGHTGGFGEPGCNFCHTGLEVNDEIGSLELLGLPVNGYLPGARYVLIVRLLHPELRLAGFQLSARFGAEGEEGTQAGHLHPGEGQRFVGTGEFAVEYLASDQAGARPAREGVGEWRFEWVAPAEPSGPVVFHLSAAAADGDGSERGDRVYLLERSVAPSGSLNSS